jgi:hypothetical protein
MRGEREVAIFRALTITEFYGFMYMQLVDFKAVFQPQHRPP